MINGVRVVDVHHHALPEGVFRALQERAGGAARLVDDRISITLNEDLVRLDRHVEAMDKAGVDVALLTYSGVSVLGLGTCRVLNDGFAATAAASGGRFAAAAHVPLDAGVDGVAELERAVTGLGLRRLALPTSAPGVTLDAPILDVLWEAVALLDVPVVLHPALKPEAASTDWGLERSCARPFDTTTAAVRLVCGVLPRFPTLRFVLPHVGGTAVFLKGRLQMFFQPPGFERALPRTQRELAAEGLDTVFDQAWRRFWFDTAGTGGWEPAVRMAAEVVGPGRLMFGTDFPLESHSAETVRELVEVAAGLDEWPAVASSTAEALLGIAPTDVS